MKVLFQNYLLGSLYALIALQASNGAIGTSKLERLLSSNSFRDIGKEMVEIFRQGNAITFNLVDELDNPSESIRTNAQLMIRVIGDEQGIRALHKWYEIPRPSLVISGGPFPIPLQEWDFWFIERNILNRSSREWGNEGINYLLALAIDGSVRARGLTNRMLAAVGNDESTEVFQITKNIKASKITCCEQCTAQEFVRKNAFFLAPEDKMNVTIELLAYSYGKKKALLSTSQTFGNTFLIVLEQSDSRWKFQSVALYLTNN
jgi:hypothetical protein